MNVICNQIVALQEFVSEVFANPEGKISYDYQLQSDLAGVRHFACNAKYGVPIGSENFPRTMCTRRITRYASLKIQGT